MEVRVIYHKLILLYVAYWRDTGKILNNIVGTEGLFYVTNCGYINLPVDISLKIDIKNFNIQHFHIDCTLISEPLSDFIGKIHWKGFLFGRHPPWHGSLVRGTADSVCTEQCKLQTGWSTKRDNGKQCSNLIAYRLMSGACLDVDKLIVSHSAHKINLFFFFTFPQFIVVWCNLRLASCCFYLILIVMTTLRPTEKVPKTPLNHTGNEVISSAESL